MIGDTPEGVPHRRKAEEGAEDDDHEGEDGEDEEDTEQQSEQQQPPASSAKQPGGGIAFSQGGNLGIWKKGTNGFVFVLLEFIIYFLCC